MPVRTVMIGLAGAALPAVDAILQDGAMPFLREWSAAGVRAGLEFEPVSSTAAWISLVTGRSPRHHGVWDLFCKQSLQGHRLQALASRDIACDTLWSLADREGRRATVLNFPLTFPPPKIEGHVVPGTWISPRQLRLGCHPSDLYSRFQKVEGLRLDELMSAWLPEDGTAPPARYAEWIEAQGQRDARLFKLLHFLMEEEPSDLVLLLVRGFGPAQYAYLRFAELRKTCTDYFGALDAHLAELVKKAGREAHVALVSETSRGPAARNFFLNDWLVQRGHLAWAGGSGPATWEGPALDTDQLTRQAKLYDWARTRAWYPLAGGNGVFLVRRDELHPTGLADGEYESFRAQLGDELAAVPEIARVWKREELLGGPHPELGPDLILEMHPGFVLSPFVSTELSAFADGTTAAPQGIFFAGGQGVRQGVRLPAISLLDVAPFLLHTLGLPIPNDLEGRVPAEALDPAWSTKHAVRAGAAAAERAPDKPMLNPEAEEEILQRLRALGYLE
jgi:predicted AlkP superfamily phosphohydrolase/phosphomutase